MKIKFWVIVGFLIVFNGAFSYLLGGNFSVPEILLFLDSLLVVSAIIFGIVGAWLAIIWQNTSLSKKEQRENISYLKKTVFCSFIVITYSLVIKFLNPFIINITVIQNDIVKIWLKRIFVFSSGISGLILMVSLFFTLLSFDYFSLDNEVKKQQDEQKQEYKKRQMSQVNSLRKAN
jgi:hypothetical protein